MNFKLFAITNFLLSCSTPQYSESDSVDKESADAETDRAKKTSAILNTCYLPMLSYQFDINMYSKKFVGTENGDSCIIKLLISDKLSKNIMDSIELTSLLLFRNSYSNCDSITSFTTNYKSDRKIMDNYFGDIVIADFNFDSKDDIALINDGGGNGGPLYTYYVQKPDKKFSIDHFLTDSMIFFPHSIDAKSRKLTTYVHADACCIARDVYYLNSSKNTWKHFSHKIDFY